MKKPFFDTTPQWRQCLLRLTGAVTIETRRRCMCIPTREDAKEEAVRLRKQHGAELIAVRISKNGKGKRRLTHAPTRCAKCAPRHCFDCLSFNG